MGSECRACFEHERFGEPHCGEHCDCVDCEPRRLRKRIAELEAENARLKRQYDTCWHCLDSLEPPESPAHCENCPAYGDCDDEHCEEEGCVEQRKLFARALIARIDRDGGQKQSSESLQMSCYRASETVAEMQAALDAWAKGGAS